MSSYEQVEDFEEGSEGEYLPASPESAMLPKKDDDKLDYTQDIRGMVIAQLSEGGKFPIHDKDQMNILDKMLNGIDKQVLGKKRVEVSKEAARDINQTARLLEELSKQVTHDHGVDPMKEILKNHQTRDPSVFNRDIRANFTDILDDELTLERREENSEEFFRRFEQDHNIEKGK